MSPDLASVDAAPREAGVPDEFVTAVLAASWLLVGISARTLDEVDDSVTLPQFRVMAVLADRGTTNLSRLADDLSVNAASATRVIDRLITRGLVDRVENPTSRREVVLSLTPAGDRLVAEVVARRRTEIADLIRWIKPDDQVALVDALRVFATAAEVAGLHPAAHAALGW